MLPSRAWIAESDGRVAARSVVDRIATSTFAAPIASVLQEPCKSSDPGSFLEVNKGVLVLQLLEVREVGICMEVQSRTSWRDWGLIHEDGIGTSDLEIGSSTASIPMPVGRGVLVEEVRDRSLDLRPDTSPQRSLEEHKLSAIHAVIDVLHKLRKSQLHQQGLQIECKPKLAVGRSLLPILFVEIHGVAFNELTRFCRGQDHQRRPARAFLDTEHHEGRRHQRWWNAFQG
mmetsp:Transcript_60716/g.132881  ORF Transcript_60716/g.132881 Transcript_60716/m.132881 type:complete len:230 (-) Transcript_60716:801-1490(-)